MRKIALLNVLTLNYPYTLFNDNNLSSNVIIFKLGMVSLGMVTLLAPLAPSATYYILSAKSSLKKAILILLAN